MATWLETLELLKSMFPMPDPAIRKCEVLYTLAKSLSEGDIVELGSYHGRTAIALSKGSEAGHNLKVYCIDDYADHQDWANNLYTIRDIEIFQENIKKAKASNVVQIYKNVRNAAYGWGHSVSILFWDTSVTGELFEDWLAWRDHITGIAFLRDTFDKRLGSLRVLHYESERSEFKVLSEEPGILLLQRSK